MLDQSINYIHEIDLNLLCTVRIVDNCLVIAAHWDDDLQVKMGYNDVATLLYSIPPTKKN